jgi:two-component system response regulator ChvI
MSVLRRRCCTECGTVIDSGQARLVRGPLWLDRALRRVTWRGTDIHLTAQEFEVLELLAQREGRLVQGFAFFNAEIFDEDTDDKIVDVIICKIRAKFRAVDPSFDALVTHWGDGYRWRPIEGEPPPQVDAELALRARLQRPAA